MPDALLESSYGTALFRAFLQREYAEENLDFVIKVFIIMREMSFIAKVTKTITTKNGLTAQRRVTDLAPYQQKVPPPAASPAGVTN